MARSSQIRQKTQQQALLVQCPIQLLFCCSVRLFGWSVKLFGVQTVWFTGVCSWLHTRDDCVWRPGGLEEQAKRLPYQKKIWSKYAYVEKCQYSHWLHLHIIVWIVECGTFWYLDPQFSVTLLYLFKYFNQLTQGSRAFEVWLWSKSTSVSILTGRDSNV